MNVFSKLPLDKCTKFLFLLIVCWLFSDHCFARDVDSLKETESEIESTVPESNSVEKKQNESEKITEVTSSKEAESKTGTSVQEQNDIKSSEDVIAEFMKSFSGVKISGIRKPFKDYPGYWNQLNDFDVEITCVEANDNFPSGSFRLKDLKGNVVILFFTTKWCPNCVKVFQDLDVLSKKLSEENVSNVKIITLVIGTENDDTVKNYYETNKVKSLCRFKSISPLFFKVVGGAIPTCFVFNKKSVPVWGFSGIANYGSLDFLDFIKALSKEDLK